MNIVRFALRYPYTFYVVAALILFLGVTAIRTMPRDIFPEIRIPVVTVIWQYTGLSVPDGTARHHLQPICDQLERRRHQEYGSADLQWTVGSANLLQPDVNLDLAISQIVSATNFIRVLMPPGIQAPVIVQFNASSVPVLQISLSSETLNEQRLYYGSTAFDSGWRRSVASRRRRRPAANIARSWSISIPPNCWPKG